MKKNESICLIGNESYLYLFEKTTEEIYARYPENEGYHISTQLQIIKDYCSDIQKIRNQIKWATTLVFCFQLVENMENELSYLLNELSTNIECSDKKIILSTIPECQNRKKTKKINKFILEVANQNKYWVANFQTYWNYYRKLHPAVMGDGKFNKIAIEIMRNALIPLIIRSKTLVLWQYNGRYAHCNYSCPYCYVATSVNKGMHFQFSLKKWETAFEKHFGQKNTVFYFSYGEPLMGGGLFYDILEMIGKHNNWEVRMTSNISVSLERLLNTTLARTGRLNINTSFHPTQISVEKFIGQCDEIRKAGIEPSIVYVMYPDQIDDFINIYLEKFRERGYRVHIRAFRGLYKGKKYPQAYNREQWVKVAKYMDEANFKYQLQAVNGLGRLSFLGMTHILVDNYGKIEMCDSYVGDRSYGNVFDEEIHLNVEPKAFPGLVPLAAVDDIADYVELGFNELEGNNINSYLDQGKVLKNKKNEIIYPYENVDLFNSELINELTKVPKPQVPKCYFWLNPKWIAVHFIYSYLIKKYGKYIGAWLKGKFRLAKKGELTFKNFWHS